MKLSAVQLKGTVAFFTIAVLAASGFGIFKRQEAQNLCVAPRAWADQLQSFKSRLSLIEGEGGFGGSGFKNMLKSGALLYFKVRSAEEFKEDLQTMAKPFALQIGSVTLTDAALPQIDPENIDYQVSPDLKAELRPYQMLGVKWLKKFPTYAIHNLYCIYISHYRHTPETFILMQDGYLLQ